MRRLLRYLLTKCNQPALDLERQRHELRQAQLELHQAQLEVWIVLDKIAHLLVQQQQQEVERQRWQPQYERK